MLNLSINMAFSKINQYFIKGIHNHYIHHMLVFQNIKKFVFYEPSQFANFDGVGKL